LIADLAGLPCLEALLLAGNQLNDTDLALEVAAGPIAFKALSELDLSKNSLSRFPDDLVARAPELRALALGHNQILSSKEDQEWGRQVLEQNRKILDLKLDHNKLGGLGALRFLDSLVHLGVENNELRAIPPELGLLPKLSTLQCGGNPQRTVPVGVVQGPTASLLELLRNRLGPNYEPPAWALQAKGGGGGGQRNPLNPTPAASPRAGPPLGSSSSAGSSAPTPPPSAPPPASAQAEAGAGLSNVAALRAEVEALDRQLEGGGLSAAAKHALKKKRQLKNAERIRAERAPK